MKRVTVSLFYVFAICASLTAVLLDNYALAIWLAVLLILIEIDQIHDTLKGKSAPQGSDK